MECIQHIETGVIDRVKDDLAHQKVGRGTWEYIGKEIWKKSLREAIELKKKEDEERKEAKRLAKDAAEAHKAEQNRKKKGKNNDRKNKNR